MVRKNPWRSELSVAEGWSGQGRGIRHTRQKIIVGTPSPLPHPHMTYDAGPTELTDDLKTSPVPLNKIWYPMLEALDAQVDNVRSALSIQSSCLL